VRPHKKRLPGAFSFLRDRVWLKKTLPDRRQNFPVRLQFIPTLRWQIVDKSRFLVVVHEVLVEKKSRKAF